MILDMHTYLKIIIKMNYILLTFKSSEYFREKFELLDGSSDDDTVAVVEVVDEHLEIESSSESYCIDGSAIQFL